MLVPVVMVGCGGGGGRDSGETTLAAVCAVGCVQVPGTRYQSRLPNELYRKI